MSPFVNVKYDGVSSTMGGELTIDADRGTNQRLQRPDHD